jgi:hypothetical protein
MGDHARHDGAHVCREGRAAVEAEPADPEEDGAEHDVGDVVRTGRQAADVVVAPPLAQHDGVGEGSSAGGDVHRCAAGEVETSHFEGPAGGVPGPAGDGVVDDGAPDEHEDYARQHAASVCCGANRQSGTRLLVSFHLLLLVDIEGMDIRDSSKHPLINRKQQIRDPRTADTRRTQHVPEPDILQITDEGIRRVREGEGVAPEEPLEGDHADGHAGEPDEGECRFAACEARVEEAHTGDHEEDERGGGEHPGYVARLSISAMYEGNGREGCTS